MEEVYQFLKDSETYYIATLEDDQPRVRPFGTVDIFEGRLYIQTGKSKKVSQQMHAHPKIEICAMLGDQWIRIQAEAVEDERIEAQQHLLDAYPSLQDMYRAGDGNNEVFYLKNAVATIYSFKEAAKTITF